MSNGKTETTLGGTMTCKPCKLVRRFFRMELSDTARSLIWLFQNDRKGWKRTEYDVVHPGARVGVWIANSTYGLSVYHNVPREDAEHGFILHGRQIELGWYDRSVLFKMFREKNRNPRQEGYVSKSISEWAMLRPDDFIRSDTDTSL